MKEIMVEIEGTTALLMNRFPEVEIRTPKAKRTDEQYDIQKDVERALYKDDEIGCFVPNSWIEACLRETAKTFKAARGKGTLKKIVLASVFIEPERIALNKKTYDEMDIRPVVIMKNRIVRGRPRFNHWNLQFTLTYDENRIDYQTLRQLVGEAGVINGIGDYRPRFGRFHIVRFDEVPVR
jgi:hypothetical protein